jgi:SAM-dependent methyltransferase
MQAGIIESACPICESTTCTRVGPLSFYMRDGQVPSDLWRCARCKSWWRSFPSPVNLHDHFAVASYSDPDREEEWRRNRQSFFDHLVRRTLEAAGRPKGGIRVLDVGCAYGHLMETFARRDCDCAGVEPVAGQRELLRHRGKFTVMPSLEAALESSDRFDAVLAIDSLYYMPGPPAVHLRQLVSLLRPKGILLLRIANRAPVLGLSRMLRRPITNDLFGDALFCFSDRGIRWLLRSSGCALESCHAYEHKRVPPGNLRGFVLNRLLPAAAALTGLKVSPGLTYVCRKSDDV